MSLDNTVFKNTTLADLFAEIHSNSAKKRTQIEGLIGELKPLIESMGDAMTIVPLIRDYLDAGLKNDDMLVKLATIIQRLESANAKNSPATDEDDLENLLDMLEQSKNTPEKPAEESGDAK